MLLLDREALNFIFSRGFWRMSLLWTFSLLGSYLKLVIDGLGGKTITFPHLHPDASTRPVCIITGATSGLGEAAVKCLLGEGFYVILAGRSSGLLSKTVEELGQKGNVLLKEVVVDLASLDSMLKFKESVQQWLLDSGLHPSIQLLINNAGILATSQSYTVDGYDRMIGTNYFGAFSLTNLLLPLLRNSYQPSRIVNVTSFTHRSICLLMFSYELHRQLCLSDPLHHVSVTAADPGVVKTGIMREVPFSISRMAYKVLDLAGLLQSPEMGVSSIIDAALAPPEASGRYFFGGGGRTTKSSALSYNKEFSEQLWTCSNKLLHQKLSGPDHHFTAQ
ncbi:Dehydrogenase/reductase SDR family member on chromosome [Nymphaea thermarum]|nr:Dehydrogenase/reductase SDR family member on chromosome [Nymphaea thermarum]